MAVMCQKCKYIIKGAEGLHTVSKCPKCGQTDKDMFIRVEIEDFEPEEHEKDKEWLESHRAD